MKYHDHMYFGREEGGGSKFKLEPDFILKENESGKVVSILDAKFKYPFNDNGVPGISGSDLYQLTTYGSAYHCNTLIVIYPLFYNAPYSDCYLTKYMLKTGTDLYLLQIDITREEIHEVQNELLSVFSKIINYNTEPLHEMGHIV